MAVSRQMKYILLFIVLALIPGIVCASDAELSLRGRFNASSAGDLVLPGIQTVTHEGYIRLAGGSSPLTNVTMTLQVDNITKIDDSAYAQGWTRTFAHWVFPPNFTITSTAKLIDWTTDTNPTDNVPVTFSRTLNQTNFSQNGYQLVQCNVTFWNVTNVTIIWGEVDNYKRDKVNVTILNNTFTTDLPNTSIMFQNNKQYQFSMMNMSKIIIGHPYTFSVVLKIDRIDPTKNVTYKPLCGINLITTIAGKSIVEANQTINIPESELPPYVHQASASINESANWSYWSHYERSALLLENSSAEKVINGSKIGIYNGGNWYIDFNGDGLFTPSTGDRYIPYGATGWTQLVGDWNGDGKSEIGIYNDGLWYIDYGGSGVIDANTRYYSFGGAGWTPLVGDWNGDKKGEIGVYNAGNWYLDYDGNGVWSAGDKNFGFGTTGWTPVTGKWTNDGYTKIGIYKDGNWYIDFNGDGQFIPSTGDRYIPYGATGWTKLVGDWNGDGKKEIGIYKDGVWYIDYGGSGMIDADTRYYSFGGAGWTPLIGDWNADTRDEIGVYNAGNWYLDYDGNGVWSASDKNYGFGTTGWTPVVGKW